MPFTPPPHVPDFNPGNGSRLTTDRYDFEAHLEGVNPPIANAPLQNFRHNATQVDLSPDLVIDGDTALTVQQALELLAAIVSPPSISPATTTSLGIVQLSGDITGTATNVVIKAIQGKPITTVVPVTGNVLTWNGTAWTPLPSPGSVVFSGDLSGTNAGPQAVVGLTGNAGSVAITAANLLWGSLVVSPQIRQITTISGGANDLSIIAQTSTAGRGGNTIISGGNGTTTRGGVILQDGVGNQTFQLGSGAAGRFTSLGSASSIISSMSSGTGDLVTLFGNAATNPSNGSSAGPIVYGSNGQLWVMQSDNTNFPVGSIPNPSTWGTLASNQGQTITYRDFINSPVGIPVSAPHTFALPDNTATRLDVILVAKANGTADSAQYNLSIGYVRNGGGAPVAVGTLTSADSRVTNTITMSSAPNITISGNNAIIQTGASSTLSMNWVIITQVVMCQF